jgi:hypothetical protein
MGSGKGGERMLNEECENRVSVDGLQEPKAQVAGAAHTLSVCKRHLAHELLPLLILIFTTTIDLRLMGTSPDEDLISYVHIAHDLESLVRSTLVVLFA